MSTMTLRAYRQPLIGSPDPLFRRALKIAGGVGVAFLACVWLAPHRTVAPPTVDEVPERLAKLILEEPAPPAPKVQAPRGPVAEAPPAPPKPQPPPVAARPPTRAPARRAVETPKLAEDRGRAGRERAKQEVQQQLASVTTTLDEVVGDLSAALASNDDGKPARERPASRRRTRSARGAAALAGVAGSVPTLPGDASGSALDAADGGVLVDAIETIGGTGDGTWADDPGAEGGAAGGTGHSEWRSDRSLLEVVRRYAPGIRYCYDHELKSHPELGGKLVVSITVAASGRVTDAAVVSDTVDSASLTACALAQIEAWKFPAIPEGVVTFRSPFVFTPPE